MLVTAAESLIGPNSFHEHPVVAPVGRCSAESIPNRDSPRMLLTSLNPRCETELALFCLWSKVHTNRPTNSAEEPFSIPERFMTRTQFLSYYDLVIMKSSGRFLPARSSLKTASTNSATGTRLR